MKRDPFELLALAGRVALIALPGGLVLYLGLNAGGFFPDSVAFAAIIVLQALVLRTVLADDPAGGFRLLAGIVALALGALALWTLVSASWSDATGRAVVDANRTLLYALVFVLFASVPRRDGDLAWMTRVVAAVMVGLSTAGLVTRLLPEQFSVDLDFAANRLSHPLTYWNALGLVAALGVLLCFHLTASRREHVAVRVLAAAAVPVCWVTLYFTFSRGAIVALAIGLVLYVALTRGVGQLVALAVTGPATAVALVLAYDADQLASREPTTAVAVEQGEELGVALAIIVALVVAVRLAVALAGRRIGPRLLPAARERRVAAVTWGVILVVSTVTLLAVDAPGRVYDAADTFLTGDPEARPGGPGDDLRDRLVDPANNGRTEHWEVALDAFADEPLRGHGAAVYEILWAYDRDTDVRVLDAHSLYLEVLAEFGLVGALLLLVALVGILVAFARGLRGPEGALRACLLAAGVVWCLRAAGDWDWEMPATGIWLFALGGTAAAASWRRDRPPAEHRPRWVVPVALGWIALAVGPLLVMLSQSELARAKYELGRGDCDAAADHALASIKHLGSRREPYELLGLCQAARGFPRQGVDAARRAIEQDPRSWEARFAFALVRAQAGEDPWPDLRHAQRLNPRERLIAGTMERFREAPRTRWPQVAARSQQIAIDIGRLGIAEQ